MVSVTGSSRAIALLCYISAVTADRLHQPNRLMNYPRQFSFSNSSSIPPSSSSVISSTSSFTISSTSSFTSSSSSFFTSSSPGSSSTPPTTSTQSTVTTSTAPVIITVDWNTVSASTTTSVASATHNSNGWPIIPFLNCWFCLPGGSDGGGIIIPGVTGPGIIPPPPISIGISLGFSSNMPSITLNPEGDPSYPSTEPTSSPSTEPTSSPSPTTMSTVTQSSSSECTSTTTGYDYFVTCTASVTDSLLLSASTGCVTSTVTTTGCDITSTASTTIVQACAASVYQSVSSLNSAQALSAITVISGTTIPLDFYFDDTATPTDFTVSHFGSIFTDNSISSTSAPITTASSSIISTISSSSTPVASTPAASSPSSFPTSSPSDSPASSPSASPTPSSSSSPTSAAPTPTATWYLTAYDVDCDTQQSSGDFSYYTFQGYSAQSPDEQCSNIQSGLPIGSDTGDSCSWFTDGGFNGPNECSQGTFTRPKSFNIRSGFCTIFEDTHCQGGSNGVTSPQYSGCMNVDDAFVDFDWNSISCFAIG
ncbi:hypothetical protein E0Z10_g716 [Xylaria hypoxylon]|uniref:Secreted LysM effector LysM C-terminal domain-containing protein n=1 Tax=Xylaria hypoxylon TaxID=37992 RepID=A0A4Z0YUA2_9PEZI|nr:hypothetical protein E0Z10_g716 [Xylaria hypoxylon]